MMSLIYRCQNGRGNKTKNTKIIKSLNKNYLKLQKYQKEKLELSFEFKRIISLKK